MDNIELDLAEIGLGGEEWIGLAQDRYGWRSPRECGNKSSVPMKCWETIE
jgi:hypothetical protein